MALTTSAIINLILKYIGGVPLQGNPAQVYAGDKIVAVQRTDLTGLAKSLSGGFNLESIVGQLVKNPLGGALTSIGSQISSLTSTLGGLGLPTELLTSATTALSTLQTTTNTLFDVTDVMSGLITDPAKIAVSGVASLPELMGLPNTDVVETLAGTLLQPAPINQVAAALNPAIPGGVTPIINSLQTATTVGQQTQLVESLVKVVNQQNTVLDNIVTEAQTTYSTFQSQEEASLAIGSMAPSNVDNPVFSVVAKPLLQTIAYQWPVPEGGMNIDELNLVDSASSVTPREGQGDTLIVPVDSGGGGGSTLAIDGGDAFNSGTPLLTINGGGA